MIPSSTPYAYERSIDPLTVIAARITSRDRWLLTLLYEHRVLTSEHLTALVFPNIIRTRQRLLHLYRMGVVDRFRPLSKAGSLPFHYTLGPIGAELLAAERDLDPKQLLRNRNRTVALAASPQLAHIVGVNGFFATLATIHRIHPEARLTDWWSERQCIRKWGERIRPDGYGVLTVAGEDKPFFLEYDRGTETLGRVAAKLDAYRKFQFGTVLFWFPSTARERNFLRECQSSSIPFAVANVSRGVATDDVWMLRDGVPKSIVEIL